MTCAKILNSLGLVFDIAGAVLLFKFGLPGGITKAGGDVVVITSPESKAQAKSYEKWSMAGILLLIIGFALQLISNFF